MRNGYWKLFFVASAAVVLFAAGCRVVEAPDANFYNASAVLREQFCMQFDEYRTTGEFESEVVCEKFAQDIGQWLSDKGYSGEDIKRIFMSGGLILEGNEFQGEHAWDITSSVEIKRTDIDDGPERLLKPQTVTIPMDIEAPKGYKPRLDPKGVKLVNRALRNFVDGELPVLVVKMVSTDVDPEPSEANPLIFSWQACIEVQVILQRGGGDDDSESSDSDDSDSRDDDSESSDSDDSDSRDDDGDSHDDDSYSHDDDSDSRDDDSDSDDRG